MNPKNPDTALLLRDIQLPEIMLWWPLAPGWWIIMALTVILVISIFIFKKNHLKRKMIDSINSELKRYYSEYQKNSDTQIFIQQLSAFLRRVALYCYQEQQIAKLQGREWLVFLDSKLPELQAKRNSQRSFISGVGKIFLLGPYQKNIKEDLYPVYELVEYWVNTNLNSKNRL